MRIFFMISVVGRIKRGGESTSIGLVSFLKRSSEVHVFSGGSFSFGPVTDLGFPHLPNYTSFYDSVPQLLKKRILRRFHLDPLSIRNFLFCKRAHRHICDDPPDLIVFRSVGPWGAKYGRWLRKRYAIPFVTIEGGWKKGERETARYNPNLHISVNVDVAKYLQNQIPDLKILRIPNGITVSEFEPNGKIADVALPRPLIIGCGFLGDVKRFHLAIKSVHRLGKGSLLLLGKGNQEEYLKQLGEKLLGDRFQISSVPYEEIASHYRAADLVTIPSAGESFGMAYLEAMACNTPVVATLDQNRKLIVGQGGSLVDPEDIDSYAAAMNHCLETDFRDLPRKQAEKFDWDIIGPKYLTAFEEVIAKAENRSRSYPIHRRMG